MQTPKLKFHFAEKIIVLPFPKTPRGNKYAITNHGQVVSFMKEIAFGNFLKPAILSGYPAVSIRINEKPKTFLIHRLVAKHFAKRLSLKHKFVIHIDNRKDNNIFTNLKWVTLEDRLKHALKYRRTNHIGNYKLTIDKVILIKKRLAKGNIQLNVLAKKYHVSDMQIHRIKTGENWSHVKIDSPLS